MVETIFKIPIYNIKIKLVLCDDIDDYVEKHEIDDRGLKCGAIFYPRLELMIFTEKYIKSHYISHEAFHITCHCMNTAGNYLTDSSEEAYAYLLQYIHKVLVIKLIELKQLKNGNTGS